PDRGRAAEPPREPQPAPPSGTRPAPARERSPRTRWEAPAQPAGTGQPHGQFARAPDPPPDRDPHPGEPQRGPRRRQRLQADRSDARYRHAGDAGEQRAPGGPRVPDGEPASA